MHPSHTTEDAIIHIVPWKDALVEGHGYAIDDPYIEMFWLPILGPTATWLVRRLAGGLQHQPEGYTVDMTDLARGIGVNYTPGRHNPFARAQPNRLQSNHIAQLRFAVFSPLCRLGTSLDSPTPYESPITTGSTWPLHLFLKVTLLP